MHTARFSALLALFLLPAAVLARAWDSAKVNSHPATFLAGVFAGVVLHETGHLAVAVAEDIDVKWHNVSITYTSPMTDAEHLRVASAGIQAQWLLSECVLRRSERKQQPLGAFEAGVVVSHLAISAAYLTMLKDHEEGDLLGISDASGLSTDELALLIALPAALDAWRLFGNDVPEWVPALSAGYKGAAMAAVWKF